MEFLERKPRNSKNKSGHCFAGHRVDNVCFNNIPVSQFSSLETAIFPLFAANKYWGIVFLVEKFIYYLIRNFST